MFLQIRPCLYISNSRVDMTHSTSSGELRTVILEIRLTCKHINFLTPLKQTPKTLPFLCLAELR
jgi:hypothetical protein